MKFSSLTAFSCKVEKQTVIDLQNIRAPQSIELDTEVNEQHNNLHDSRAAKKIHFDTVVLGIQFDNSSFIDPVGSAVVDSFIALGSLSSDRQVKLSTDFGQVNLAEQVELAFVQVNLAEQVELGFVQVDHSSSTCAL